MFGIDDLIGAGIGAGTSLLGGWLQSRAAKKAADEQRKIGNAEADKLLSSATASANRINEVGGAAAYGVEDAGRTADARIGEAGRQGQEAINASLQRFTPYSQAGTDALSRLQAGIAPGGEFAGQFNGDINGFTNDAGFKYRLTQFADAAQNTAAGKGLVGGNVVKAIETYRQDQASQEAAAAYDRAKGTFQMNRDNTLNPLQALVGVGERANNSILGGTTTSANLGLDTAQSQSQFGLDTAKTAGGFRLGSAGTAEGINQSAANHAADLRTGAAAAGSAGTIGSGNAWADALSNVAKSVDLTGLTRRKPAANPSGLPTVRNPYRVAA